VDDLSRAFVAGVVEGLLVSLLGLSACGGVASNRSAPEEAGLAGGSSSGPFAPAAIAGASPGDAASDDGGDSAGTSGGEPLEPRDPECAQAITWLSPIEVTSQEQLDALPLIYSAGDVTISNVENLARLGCLTTVHSLRIRNVPALVELSGLERLHTVALYFGIDRAAVRSLSALGRLQSVGGIFSLSALPALPDLHGLEDFTEGHIVAISKNPVLHSLKGLGLRDLREKISGGNREQGEIRIEHNPALGSLEGFQVQRVGLVVIWDNDSLTSLDALASLTAIDFLVISENRELLSVPLGGLNSSLSFSLTIDRTPSLRDLSGIEHLRKLSEVRLTENPVLEDIDALSELEIGALTLSGNASLADLSALQHLTALDTLTIEKSPKITSLAAFRNLTFAHSLTINDTGLTDLAGLERLEIDRALRITENQALESVTGLGPGTRVLHDLLLRANARLTDLSGLYKLETVRTRLSIASNPSLSACQAKAFAERVVSSDALLELANNELDDSCN
jgi:hypothetical protein